MFFEERCTLCGGKLDKKGICTECGLDNKKSERHYKVNQSSCDGQPLTHVHDTNTGGQTAQKKDIPVFQRPHREKTPFQSRKQGNGSVLPGRKKGETREDRASVAKILFGVTVLIILVVLVLYFVELIVQENQWGQEGYSDELYSDGSEYDPYAYVTKESPESGESYSGKFSQGDYVVGVHIPEGTYTMTADEDGYMSLSVEDKENGIYLYESVNEEVPEVDDIRLFDQAVLSVSGEGYLTLSADNAQTEQMWSVSNPLTKTVRIESGQTMTAGKDFPEGVYDIRAREGYGSPEVIIYDEEGNILKNLYPWLYDMSETECTYKNAVFPAGAVIENSEEELTLELVPSELISSEEYLEYYTY